MGNSVASATSTTSKQRSKSPNTEPDKERLNQEQTQLSADLEDVKYAVEEHYQAEPFNEHFRLNIGILCGAMAMLCIFAILTSGTALRATTHFVVPLLCSVTCMLVGFIILSRCGGPSRAHAIYASRWSSDLLLKIHWSFSLYSVYLSLVYTPESVGFQRVGDTHEYWIKFGTPYHMTAPLVELLSGIIFFTLGGKVRHVLLWGGSSQVMFIVACWNLLSQVIDKAHPTSHIICLMVVQQLAYGIGSFIGLFLIRSNRRYFELAKDARIELLERRVEQLEVEKDRLEYDRKLAQHLATLTFGTKRLPPYGSIENSSSTSSSAKDDGGACDGQSAIPEVPRPDTDSMGQPGQPVRPGHAVVVKAGPVAAAGMEAAANAAAVADAEMVVKAAVKEGPGPADMAAADVAAAYLFAADVGPADVGPADVAAVADDEGAHPHQTSRDSSRARTVIPHLQPGMTLPNDNMVMRATVPSSSGWSELSCCLRQAHAQMTSPGPPPQIDEALPPPQIDEALPPPLPVAPPPPVAAPLPEEPTPAWSAMESTPQTETIAPPPLFVPPSIPPVAMLPPAYPGAAWMAQPPDTAAWMAQPPMMYPTPAVPQTLAYDAMALSHAVSLNPCAPAFHVPMQAMQWQGGGASSPVKPQASSTGSARLRRERRARGIQRELERAALMGAGYLSKLEKVNEDGSSSEKAREDGHASVNEDGSSSEKACEDGHASDVVHGDGSKPEKVHVD